MQHPYRFNENQQPSKAKSCAVVSTKEKIAAQALSDPFLDSRKPVRFQDIGKSYLELSHYYMLHSQARAQIHKKPACISPAALSYLLYLCIFSCLEN